MALWQSTYPACTKPRERQRHRQRDRQTGTEEGGMGRQLSGKGILLYKASDLHLMPRTHMEAEGKYLLHKVILRCHACTPHLHIHMHNNNIQ